MALVVGQPSWQLQVLVPVSPLALAQAWELAVVVLAWVQEVEEALLPWVALALARPWALA
jgi:hypothetical protein